MAKQVRASSSKAVPKKNQHARSAPRTEAGKGVAKSKAQTSTKPHPNGKPVAKGKSNGKAKPAEEAASASPAPPRKPTELETKVVHLIAEEMAIEEAELTLHAVFKEDLGLDEIDVAELLMQAEQAFGVHPFNELDWESCATVGDFVGLVEKRVTAKRSRKGRSAKA